MDALASLRRAQPHHYYYPLESLHMTVQSFRGLPEGSSALRLAVDRLRSSVTTRKPPLIALRGVGLARESILTWTTVHRWQFDRTRRAGSVPGSVSRTLPPHVNLVRLAEPPDEDLRGFLSPMRSTDLGSFAPEEVVVVRCNAVMAPESLEILERVPFLQEIAGHGA